MAESSQPVDSPQAEAEEIASGATEEIVRGRSGSTPFVVLGGVALTVWAIAAALMALAGLLIWLLV